MRLNCLISIIVVVNFILSLQMGCQEQAKPPKEPEAVLPAPAQVTSPEKAEAEKVTPEKAKIKKEAIQTGPKITFENVVYDFGEVGPQIKLTGEFKFTNTGDSLLEIDKVEGCCGVATKLDKMKYQPGESGTLTVEYSSGPQAGVMRRQLYVVSNDKTNPRAALTVKATIVPKVSYEPQGGLNLLLKGEDVNCPKITLTSLDGKPFSIRAFTSTGNCITADYDPAVSATKFVLQPKIDMEKLQRSSNGFISISLTHPQSSSITIPFNVLSRFKITPPQIIVFNAEPGTPVTRRIWVLNNYGEVFEIESASSQNNIIKVLSQDKINTGYQFMLEIMPPPDEGKTSFMDVFNVNIKGAEKLAIACRGFYLKRK